MTALAIQPNLTVMRLVQQELMTETATLIRNGLSQGSFNFRVGSERMFTEPSDPQDANTRSATQWGFTFAWNADVQVGDVLVFSSPSQHTVIGEVLDHNTWQIATRAFGMKPKFATPVIAVSFFRYNSTTESHTDTVAPQSVRVVYDHVAPAETPIRYSPAGRSQYQGGRLIKEDSWDVGFDVQVGDQFFLYGQPAVITEVLGGQPLATEARFDVNISGPR